MFESGRIKVAIATDNFLNISSHVKNYKIQLWIQKF